MNVLSDADETNILINIIEAGVGSIKSTNYVNWLMDIMVERDSNKLPTPLSLTNTHTDTHYL